MSTQSTPTPIHFLSADDLRPDLVEDVWRTADEITEGRAPRLEDRVVATLFYEPSTRTRLSFESASLRLGCGVIGFADAASASVVKGESLIDTIRMVERYADVIVLRHKRDGASALAATVSRVPIINAGDGGHEHPTQTLTDLYTIQRHRKAGASGGRLKVGFVGDLRYGRTAHSLAVALSMRESELVFIAGSELQMPDEVIARFRKGCVWRREARLEKVIGELDVLYVTRIQTERLPTGLRETPGDYPIGPATVAKASPDLMILHPLPRVGEILYELDADPRALYFEQAANGVPVRMALLANVLTKAKRLPLGGTPGPAPKFGPEPVAGRSCGNPNCITRHERDTPARAVGEACFYCGHGFEGG